MDPGPANRVTPRIRRQTTKRGDVLVAHPSDTKWRNDVVPARVFAHETDHVVGLNNWFDGLAKSRPGDSKITGVIDLGGSWFMWYIHTDRTGGGRFPAHEDERFSDWLSSVNQPAGNLLAADLIGDHFSPYGFNPVDDLVMFAKIGKNSKLIATGLSVLQKLKQIKVLVGKTADPDSSEDDGRIPKTQAKAPLPTHVVQNPDGTYN